MGTKPTATRARVRPCSQYSTNFITQSEFRNEVPAMSNEDLLAWFRKNAEYLDYKQQSVIRRCLGLTEQAPRSAASVNESRPEAGLLE